MKYFLFILLITQGCASNLKHEKRVTRFSGDLVDLSSVSFAALYTKDTVNLKDYMVKNKKDYVLLMFGSIGCSSCNKKDKEITSNFLNSHPVFTDTALSSHFELIGVSTDSNAALTRLKSVLFNPTLKEKFGYSFIKWSDPAGLQLKKYFIKDNERFGIPYLVFISLKGILWRYNNSDEYTLEEIFDKVQAAITKTEYHSGNGTTGNQGNDEDDNDDTDDNIDTQESYKLSFEREDRFSGIAALDCNGKTHNLQNLTTGDLNFIQISKDRCPKGSICKNNYDIFKDVSSMCKTITCTFTTLTIKDISDDLCPSSNIYKGGKDFYSVFESIFNWNYTPDTDQWNMPISLPEVKGPIILGFNKTGKLIYKFEGSLPKNSSDDSIENVIIENPNTRPISSNFKLFGDYSESNPQNINFFDYLQQSKFTVVAAFDQYCDGCIKELKHWNEENQLYDYCASNPDICQLIALEGYLAIPNTESGRLNFYNQVKTILNKDHIRVPLFLDIESRFTENSKFFEGYLLPYFPDWMFAFGTVIYDNEGKILYNLKSTGPEDPDPILNKIKDLQEQL